MEKINEKLKKFNDEMRDDMDKQIHDVIDGQMEYDIIKEIPDKFEHIKRSFERQPLE